MLVRKTLEERFNERFLNKFCSAEGDDDGGAGGGDSSGGDNNSDSGGNRGGSLINSDAGGDDNSQQQGGDDGGQQGGDGAWFWSDGVAGEGDKPDWFQSDKYKSVDAQAKATLDAQRKLSQRDELRGAPETYEVTISDDVLSMVPENQREGLAEVPEWCVEWAKECDLTNDQMNKLINQYTKTELESLPDQKEELAKLGSTGQERVNRVANYIQKAIDPKGEPELYDMALQFTTTAAGIALFEKFMTTDQVPNLADDGDSNQGEQLQSEAELKEMMFAKDENGRRKMHTDPSYAKMVNDMYKKRYGTSSSKKNIVDISPPTG